MQFDSLFLSNHIVAILKSLLTIVAGVTVQLLLNRALNKLAEKGYVYEQLRLTIKTVTKWIITIVVLLLALSFFGVSVATLWAALSAILVLFAVGFVAVWSVLSNVFCSILLVFFAPFRIGDEIEIQEPTASTARLKGKVTGINVMYTTLIGIEEEEGELIRVPNNIFFQKFVRCWPGKQTKSLKSYVASQHQEAVESTPEPKQ